MSTTKIPSLTLGGLRFESHDLPALVVWGDMQSTSYSTVQGAKTTVLMKFYNRKNLRARGAKLFSWDGKTWRQTPF